MLAKRIVPCLDVMNGQVVKGVQFVNLKVEGDPAELVADYEDQGADEVVFLDITASHENRDTTLEVVKRTADMISIPFTVGGGIRNITDIQNALSSGADKVSVNTAAVNNPKLVEESASILAANALLWQLTLNGFMLTVMFLTKLLWILLTVSAGGKFI